MMLLEGKRILILSTDQAYHRSIRDHPIEIPDLTINVHGNHNLGKARADRRCQLCSRDRLVKGSHAAVGQGDGHRA